MSLSPQSSVSEPPVESLPRADGQTIAYCRREGQRGPGIVWMSGFHSDMAGTKAAALDRWAAETERPCLRFDYFGHGRSSGAFAEGTISRWKEDCLAVMDALVSAPQILVGSSMGGWMAALTALARPEKVAGIVFIAPAPDFTEDLMWAGFSDAVKAEIETKGFWMRPSAYEEPYPITRALIEDGRQNLVLRDETLAISCPVRILHGQRDADVPWRRSLTLAEKLQSDDVITTFIKTGDHRLSDEATISRLITTVAELAGKTGG